MSKVTKLQRTWVEPAFRVYQKAAKRRERLFGEYQEQFDAALHSALMGTNHDSEPFPTRSVDSAEAENPV